MRATPFAKNLNSMEYNELITKAQQSVDDAPDADTIIAGVHHAMRRRRQRQALVSVVVALAVGTSAFFMQPRYETSVTLAEQVSRRVDTPRTKLPAPVMGYQHSIYKRQIYTLL